MNRHKINKFKIYYLYKLLFYGIYVLLFYRVDADCNVAHNSGYRKSKINFINWQRLYIRIKNHVTPHKHVTITRKCELTFLFWGRSKNLILMFVRVALCQLKFRLNSSYILSHADLDSCSREIWLAISFYLLGRNNFNLIFFSAYLLEKTSVKR